MTILQATQAPPGAAVTTRIGEPNAVAMVFFFAFIAVTLGIISAGVSGLR